MTPSDNLSIALVIATPGTNWGGMETHTQTLASGLSRRGHSVHVFAHPNYADKFQTPVHFHSIPFQWGRRNPWLRHTLKRKLVAEKVDVIHAQGAKAARLAALTGQPGTITLGTIHGTKSSHRDYQQLVGVIGVSSRIIDSVSHPQVRLIRNGAELPDGTDAESRLAIPDIRPLLLAAGRLEPVKQFHKLINAFADASLPGCLVILGEGSQLSSLERLIADRNLEGRVFLPGYETNLGPWFEAAVACVISSEREGFPYLMVESLMADCPVLSTPVSGATEILPISAIADGIESADLANLLAESLGNPEHLRTSQQGCFDRARSELSVDNMLDQTIDFYRQLISEQRRGER